MYECARLELCFMSHWNPRMSRDKQIAENKKTRERQQQNRQRGFDHCAPRERVYDFDVASADDGISIEEARARTALLQQSLN
jgi:hypothetical protein